MVTVDEQQAENKVVIYKMIWKQQLKTFQVECYSIISLSVITNACMKWLFVMFT